MFTATYGGEVLHDPRDESRTALDQSCELSLADAGTYSFTLPATHPLAGRLEVMSRSREVALYDDGEEVFRGRVRRVPQQSLDGSWSYECEGERAYLNDVTLRPYACGAGGVPTSADGLFAWYVAQYNAAVPEADRFHVGANDGWRLCPGELSESSDARPTVWAEMKSKLVDAHGGFVRVRRENGVRWLDWLADGTRECAQRVEFGVNLTDYALERDGTELFTRVVPWARRKSEETPDSGGEAGDGSALRVAKQPAPQWAADGDEASFTVRAAGGSGTPSYAWQASGDGGATWWPADDCEGHDSATLRVAAAPAFDGRLYRAAVSDGAGATAVSEAAALHVVEHPGWFGVDGLPDRPLLEGYEKAGDAVVDVGAERAHGVIERAAEYEADDPDGLVAAALRDLRNAAVADTLRVSAVDLHRVDPSVGGVRLGDLVRVTSAPHGFDAYMLCSEVDIDPSDAESTYTLGTPSGTLTSAQADRIAALDARVGAQAEAVDGAREAAERAGHAATSAGDAADRAREAAGEAAASRVVRSEVTYAAGDSGTDPPEGPWSATPPARARGQWLWARTSTEYGDGTALASYSPSRDGEDAARVELVTTAGSALRNSRGGTAIRARVALGGERAGDAASLAALLGDAARLTWAAVGRDGSRAPLDPADPRLSEGGFLLAVDASDVDGEATWECSLDF